MTNAEFSAPHFISLLMKRGYLESDGRLEFSRDALDITQDNVAILADIVAGRERYQLPIMERLEYIIPIRHWDTSAA